MWAWFLRRNPAGIGDAWDTNPAAAGVNADIQVRNNHIHDIGVEFHGAIGIWAWGLSRALDYLDDDKDIDAHRVRLQDAGDGIHEGAAVVGCDGVHSIVRERLATSNPRPVNATAPISPSTAIAPIEPRISTPKAR